MVLGRSDPWHQIQWVYDEFSCWRWPCNSSLIVVSSITLVDVGMLFTVRPGHAQPGWMPCAPQVPRTSYHKLKSTLSADGFRCSIALTLIVSTGQDEVLLHVCVRRDYLEYLQSLERLGTSNQCDGSLKVLTSFEPFCHSPRIKMAELEQKSLGCT